MRGIYKAPEQLGAHRHAVIALYRALLTQCSRLELPQDDIQSLKNVVRNRFRVARPQRMRLGLAFESGYHALDLVDSSVAGDATATARIGNLLSRTPEHLRRSPLLNQPPKKPKNPANDLTPDEFKFEKMFPRPKVEGVRKVPFMVNAGGLPFIRWKKPQPESVSRLIKQKLMQRQKWHNLLDKLEAELLPMADREDEWEERVAAMLQTRRLRDNGGANGDSYLATLLEIESNLSQTIRQEDQKTVERVQRFSNIIFKERELAEKEKAERAETQ